MRTLHGHPGDDPRASRQAGDRCLGGEGLAAAGFWTGLVGTAISAVTLVFVVVVFAFGAAVSNSFQENCVTVGGNGQHSTTCTHN